MARNKHPEETVRRILDVAEELFCTRGYERTTMADIVEGLGGLTKGAVYHHFKSKDEIFEAVFERANRPVVAESERILEDRSLTGLEKIRALDEASSRGPSAELWAAMRPDSDPVRSSRILAREYRDVLECAHAFIEPAIREGIADGSIACEHPREAAEVMLLVANLWMAPLFNPVRSQEEFARRVEVFLAVTHALGVDVVEWDSVDRARLVAEAWGRFEKRDHASSDAATGGCAPEMQPPVG